MGQFIEPGVDLRPADEGYGHFARMDRDLLASRWLTPEGSAVLARLRGSALDRAVLDAAVGRLGGKVDLRAIPLGGAKLHKVDFSDCDLYRADLFEADLRESDLRGAYLSEASIKGADLSWSRVRETLVDNVLLDRRTRLLGIDVSGLNTNFALGLIAEIADQQRIAILDHRHPWFSSLLRLTSDHGRSLTRWAACTMIAIFLFAIVYCCDQTAYHGINGVLDGLYFSVVTFTTLGYGDAYPMTATGKAIVMAEVVTGYLMGGIFIAILTRRILG